MNRILASVMLALSMVFVVATPSRAQRTLPGYTIFVPTVRPGTPDEGTVYQSQTDHKFYIYNGSSWIAVGSVSTIDQPNLTGQWSVNGSLCAAWQVVQGGSPTTCSSSPTLTTLGVGIAPSGATLEVDGEGAIPLRVESRSDGLGWYSDFSNSINANYDHDNDFSALYANIHGFHGGTTRYRDFDVMNGKASAVALFRGATKTVEFYGPLSLNGGSSALAVANVGANSCGTTAATITGRDNALVITVGATSGTQCRVTFTLAANTEWSCTVTDSTTTIATRATPVDTTHTDFFGAFVAGDKVTGICFPR